MYPKFFKRLIDIAISIIAFPIFILIFIILAPIIHFTDGGPVFYKGKRLGKEGKIFEMYKFRSMYVNSPDIRNKDGTTFSGEHDQRVTKIGRFIRKTSLDETAQILNILKGDMALIGPRPDLVDALEIYSEEEKKKLKCRPGITGYSQAYYRNEIDLHERFKMDVYYAENISFLLDVKIFIRTIITVLSHKGIYRNKEGCTIIVNETVHK